MTPDDASPEDKTRIAPDTGVHKGVQLNGIYEIDEHIATGGMGEVYRGHNIQTGDPVAIKVVLREFARDQGILALFRKEASILNHLSNDAIVRYHVFTIDPTIGRPYLAMEFVDGQSLGERIRSGPLDAQQARKMLARVASGLSVAHEAGVIHRDLSPDNIVLPGGRVEKTKIIDFGIARSANVGGGTLLGGSFAGKYSFVSPEQLGLFGGDVTEQSDLYSLGLVLAAALRGKQLDMGGSPVEVIEKRRSVPDLSGIDPELLPLLNAMLQPDPRDRPESAAAIVEWLRETSGVTASSGTHPGIAGQLDQGKPAERTWRPPGSPASGQKPPPPESLLPRDAPWRNAGAAGRPAPDRQQKPATKAPPAAEKPKSGRGALIGILLLVAAAAAGGGVYYSGLVDGLLPGGTRPVPSDQTAGGKLTPAKPEPLPEPVAKAPPATETVAKAPTPTEIAKPKPAEPIKPIAVEPPKAAVSAAEWFKSFDGGSCFYASVANPSAPSPQVDGLATSKAPFDKLARDFSSTFGAKPAVNPRMIERDQCPVADFLKALPPGEASGPKLVLNKDNLKVGDSLQGTLSGTGSRDVNLLLIGKDGVVYNFASLLKKSGAGEATFSMKLFPLNDQEASAPEPHLIVALASDRGIKAADISDPELASDLFPKIRSEIETQPNGAGVAFGYFLFDR
ncbi:Serine/threonine-protein kinase PknA [Aminobacter sp. MSH1]|uniref:serine/threonine-protein kinase n=1 Tax=Aminobacter sp. MSH1 TaxID=374606 RepID=UPI000D3B62FA|nr:serine/threonine-protein kinase [Aminobacter sp. MSH1]AWC24027.1 Serine/threonine-protein kinase PknA [Aminobacter sp. MSH1]